MKMEARHFALGALAICVMAACSPKQTADTTALHHAATKLRVLLDQGFEPDSLTPAITDLHVELDVVKASLPSDAAGKCDRAASMGDSLRRVLPTIMHGDTAHLGQIKPDFQNLGLYRNQRDWDELQGHIAYTSPTSLDTPAMEAEREQLLTISMKEIFDAARKAALTAAKDCEKGI
jgi:hypothetical protein